MNTVVRSFAGQSEGLLQDNFTKLFNLGFTAVVGGCNLYNHLRESQLIFKLHSCRHTLQAFNTHYSRSRPCFSRSQYGSQDLMMCFMFLVYLSYLPFSLQDPVNLNCRFSHQVPSRMRIKLVMRKLFWFFKGGAPLWNTS